MRLWLVRHARPLAAEGLCYGRSELAADPAATETAAEALAGVLPRGCRLVASPLQRCEQLVQILCRHRADLMPEVDPRLVEIDFGAWESRRWDDIPRAELDAWAADFAHHRPGGGESARQVLARVGAAFDATLARGVDTAWITHAGVIRAARLWHAGLRRLDTAAQWPSEPLPHGGWQVLEDVPSLPSAHEP